MRYAEVSIKGLYSLTMGLKYQYKTDKSKRDTAMCVIEKETKYRV